MPAPREASSGGVWDWIVLRALKARLREHRSEVMHRKVAWCVFTRYRVLSIHWIRSPGSILVASSWFHPGSVLVPVEGSIVLSLTGRTWHQYVHKDRVAAHEIRKKIVQKFLRQWTWSVMVSIWCSKNEYIA